VPTFYCLGDPYYQIESPPHENLRAYFEKHASCHEVRPATIDERYRFSERTLYYNPIPGAGVSHNFSPLRWRSHPDGILFISISIARLLAYSPIYVIGADNSMYKDHYLTSESTIKERKSGQHSYENFVSEIDTIPFITRSMSDF